MLKRIVTSCAIVAGLSLLPTPPPLHAQSEPALPGESRNNGGGTSDVPEVSTGVNDDGVVQVDIATPGSGGGGGGPRSSPPTFAPACEWSPLRGGDIPSGEGNNPLPGSGEQAVDSEGRLGWVVICPGAGLEVRWVAPAVDPVTLVDPAVGRALARLPIPVPVQSPEPEIGSFVNLGMWFSIEDPGVTSARASAGGAWAEATGRFVTFSVDPGDGTGPIPCEDFGVAYEEGSNTLDEGPCGHTYLQPTPPDALHTVTYTISYEVTWRTSDGRSGTVGTFNRSFDFPFDINEVQTRGTGF